MEQSTQTERVKKKWVDQKELGYSLKKKAKEEQDREQYYITLQILKNNENERDYNIKRNKLFNMILFFSFIF